MIINKQMKINVFDEFKDSLSDSSSCQIDVTCISK